MVPPVPPLKPSFWAFVAALVIGAPLLGGCGSGSGGPIQEPTFYVIESNPAPFETLVSRTEVVRVRFSRPIDPESVNGLSVVVTAEGVGAIAGTVSTLEGTDDTLQWVPGEVMPALTNHTVRLNSSLASSSGEALGQSDGISFRTSDASSSFDFPQQSQLRQVNGLNVGRRDHRATLLADGRVLITGGRTRGTHVTDSVEVFLAAQEVFVELSATMKHARARHSATVLADGRVLLAGGWFEVTTGSIVATDHAEIYNPATGEFAAVGAMSKARADHAAFLLPDGTVLITGGSQLNGQGLIDYDDCEVFDPATGLFSPIAAVMSGYRSTHAIFQTSDDTLLVLGGSETSVTGDVFDISTQTFTQTNAPSAERPRFGAAMAQFDSGNVVMAGGDHPGTVVFASAENHFLQNTGSGLNRPRSYATATRIASDQILIAGGIDFANDGFVESSMDVVVEGGLGGSRTFATDVRFSTGMAAHAAVVLADGDVLFCGGLNEDGVSPNKRVAFRFEIKEP